MSLALKYFALGVTNMDLALILTLIPTAFLLEFLSPTPFYTVTYTYIDSFNPKGQISSFKPPEMRSAQK